MKKEKMLKYMLIFLAIFIPFREIIAYYTNGFVKFIPDLLIWGLLAITIIKNKFKINLKLYDYLFILFIIIGFISCIINSVSLLAFALQVRSIGTMYVMFYLLRTIRLSSEDYELGTKILVWVNSIIIIFACFEILSNKLLFYPQEWASSIVHVTNYSRAYSLLNNPNIFAMFTFTCMLLLYFQNESNIKKRHILFYFLALLGILLSASRSTFIVVCLFFMYVLIFSIRKKDFKNFITMMIILLFSFLSLFGIEKLKNCDELYEKIETTINQFKEKEQIQKEPEKVDNDSTNNSQSETSQTKPQENTGSTNESNSSKEPNDNINKDDSNKEESNGSIALLDRWKETTSGTTAEYSKVDGRLYFIKKGFEIFKDYPIIGTGFGTYGSAASRMVTPRLYEKYGINKGFYSDNEYIKIIVETGIIGTIVYGLFCMSLLYSQFKKKNDKNIFFLLTFFLMGMFYNILEVAPICFVSYLLLATIENSNEQKKIKNNKISILSLHLGFGGVEQVVANTANMLCDKYDVEIISLYKNKEKIPFDINEKVTIKYLTNTISNRKEIKTALKEKNILNIIREGIKALYILAIKESVMIDAIKESDSKVIISTRYSFSRLLNEVGKKEAIKMHQEHSYSVDSKYIKQLNELTNIEYVIPVSLALLDKYKNNLNAKIKFIPNALNYYPLENEVSNLDGKQLIAVGRLEEEKGFMDLIDVINELKDDNVFLNLFGDGSQREKLTEKIKSLKLDKNIKLWGFKEQSFIKKYMKESALYIMTSHEESFGLVLIEAMSYGVPCIAFDTAEGAKSIINKTNGFFIKNRDVKEMAKVIKEYLNKNKNEKKVLGDNSRKASKSYEFSKVKSEWIEFFEKILKED